MADPLLKLVAYLFRLCPVDNVDGVEAVLASDLLGLTPLLPAHVRDGEVPADEKFCSVDLVDLKFKIDYFSSLYSLPCGGLDKAITSIINQ